MARAWCEDCQRLWERQALGPEGTCPQCGSVLIRSRTSPWHFRVLLAGSAVYLLWRLGQGLDWLARYVGRHA